MNSSTYFDNKMIEEEEMEKQVNDGTFDECAYVKDDDDLCTQASMMFNVRPVLHIMLFKNNKIPEKINQIVKLKHYNNI